MAVMTAKQVRREQMKRIHRLGKKLGDPLSLMVKPGHVALSTVCQPVDFSSMQIWKHAAMGTTEQQANEGFAAALPIIEVARVVDRLRAVLLATWNGVGLAAPQIGETVRIIAIMPRRFGPPASNEMLVMINPEIVSMDLEMVDSREACLSYPGLKATVKRYKAVTVRWTGPEGHKEQAEFRDFPAIVVQHELDHLDGKCHLAEEWRKLRAAGWPLAN